MLTPLSLQLILRVMHTRSPTAHKHRPHTHRPPCRTLSNSTMPNLKQVSFLMISPYQHRQTAQLQQELIVLPDLSLLLTQLQAVAMLVQTLRQASTTTAAAVAGTGAVSVLQTTSCAASQPLPMQPAATAVGTL